MRSTTPRLAFPVLLFAALLTARVETLVGQGADSTRPGTRGVTPGAKYAAGGFRRFLLGSAYRDLWLLPVEVDTLDLAVAGGGLTPTRTGGFGQSISLQFVGNDGRPYTVRSVDKDPTKRLDEELKGTFVEDVVRDQISALFPFAALVVDPLLDATGILHSPLRLVIMPDDPRLGEFRAEFAGLLGTFVEFPNEGPDGAPGFAGSRQIEDTETMLALIREHPEDRVAAEEFLKARLLDMVIGDRDRHAGQWRWAAFPGGGGRVWRTIPEDRDQAFVDYDGFAMALARIARPQQIRFRPEYPSIIGLTFNGWEIDRSLLAGLERAVWDSVVQVVQSDLTDDVIDRAVQRLPASHYRHSGGFIAATLKSRRDALADAATEYYRLISRSVDVNGTDQRDEVEVVHADDGSVELTILTGRAPDGTPLRRFHRRFEPSETREVRLYLHGGDDDVRVTGSRGKIKIRVIGGSGDDRLANSSGAGGRLTRYYDAEGNNALEGAVRATIRDTPYVPPPATELAHQFALDWGGQHRSVPFVYVNPDLGAYFGAYHDITRFGFRKSPYTSHHTFNAGLATRVVAPRVYYDGRYTDVAGSADATLSVMVSGLEVLRYYGLGNETQETSSHSFYEVDQARVSVEPMLWWESEAGVALGAGPVFKRVSTDPTPDPPNFISGDSPRGLGGYGQIGAKVEVELDTRDRPGNARSGVHVTGGGSVYPAWLDVDGVFGEVHGWAATYLTAPIPTTPTLALRVGGKKVWGPFPYFEAAFLGGGGTLRGFRRERYAGDASAFGSAELRLDLMPLSVLVPGRFGVFGAGDVGRVFSRTDPPGSDALHTAVGGGVWMSFFDRQYTLTAAVMDGGDLTGVYIKTGFEF